MRSAFLLAFSWLLVGCSNQPAAPPAEPAPPAVAAGAGPAEDAFSFDALAMPNPAMPLEGVLTGGQPTPEDLAALAEHGYKTVINLRQADESGQEGEADAVATLGMTYLHLPIAGAEDLSEENARAFHQALSEAERPLLLHCGSSNRVGALLALDAFWIEGKSAEEALALGRAGGLTRLEEAVVARIEGSGDSHE